MQTMDTSKRKNYQTWQACEHCGVEFPLTAFDKHICLDDPQVYATAAELLPGEGGRIRTVSEYRVLANATGAPSASLLIKRFGSWGDVALEFGLARNYETDRISARAWRRMDVEVQRQIAERVEAERERRNYALRAVAMLRELRVWNPRAKRWQPVAWQTTWLVI